MKLLHLLVFIILCSCNATNYTRATLYKDNGRVVYRNVKKTRCARIRLKADIRARKQIRSVNYGIR